MHFGSEDIFIFLSILFALLYFLSIPFALFFSKKVELYFYGESIGHMIAMKNGGLPYIALRSGLYGIVFILHLFCPERYEFYFGKKKISGVSFGVRFPIMISMLIGMIMFLFMLIVYFSWR